MLHLLCVSALRMPSDCEHVICLLILLALNRQELGGLTEENCLSYLSPIVIVWIQLNLGWFLIIFGVTDPFGFIFAFTQECVYEYK